MHGRALVCGALGLENVQGLGCQVVFLFVLALKRYR